MYSKIVILLFSLLPSLPLLLSRFSNRFLKVEDAKVDKERRFPSENNKEKFIFSNIFLFYLLVLFPPQRLHRISI